jgi:hypothetical protein
MPTILIKKNDVSGNVPTTAQLTNLAGGAEIAVNTADKRMFTMNSSSAVVELGINPSSLSIANNASINILVSTTATITTLNSTSSTITTLGSTSANITTLSSTSANITTLTGTSATITTILDGSGLIRNIPQNAKTAAYTLTTADNGKYISTQSGTITVPNNTFAAGNVVSVYNDSANTISLTISTTTGYIAGTNTNKTGMALATRGVCTVLFINPSYCIVSGNVT